VNIHSKYPENIKSISDLPLFDWRQSTGRRPSTRAGLHLTRRYRVRPEIADTIAGLAGVGVSREDR
jgi:hypothetical protein